MTNGGGFDIVFLVFSMKKAIILFIFLSFSLNVYPFWIWSPKTQKWKNPKYSALATPYLQYREALKLFENEEHKAAYKGFKKLLANYPDAKEAAEAQYYVARCMEKFGKPYEAFLEYQKVIDTYPNSQRINEVVEREYSIGEYFLNREHKKWMGVSLYDFVDHPSVEIFKRIVAKVPYSEYAPRAQYKLANILIQLGRWEEAREAFQKVIDNYSDSEWAAPAKYQLAVATARAFPGADYDSSYLEEAAERLDEFIEDYPEAQISSQAQDQLKTLREREAKKSFDIARFYENQGKYKSAVLYYAKVADNYPDSGYRDVSIERAAELGELIEEGITKEDLKRIEKQRAVEAERLKKIELKEGKTLKRKKAREEKAEAKKKAKEEKIEAKSKAREEKAEAKKARRQELTEAKKVKRELKIKRRAAAAAEKELKRREKIKRKEGVKAKKEALRREKLEKKRKIRENKKRKKEELLEKKKKLKEEKLRKKRERLSNKKKLKEEKKRKKLKEKAVNANE